jgi:hypothetical protein
VEGQAKRFAHLLRRNFGVERPVVFFVEGKKAVDRSGILQRLVPGLEGIVVFVGRLLLVVGGGRRFGRRRRRLPSSVVRADVHGGARREEEGAEGKQENRAHGTHRGCRKASGPIPADP